MDVKKFVLSYYENATEDFHIKEITRPRGALSLHSHGYFQIYYIKSGRVTHHLSYASAELCAGDVFIIPPDLPHYIEPSGEGLRFYSVSFMPRLAERVSSGNKLVGDFLHCLCELSSDRVPPSLTLGQEDIIFADSLLDRIMREFLGERSGKEVLIASALALLLSVFARAYFEDLETDVGLRSDREAILHSLGYVNNHLSEPITLSEMAKRTAMSKTVFCTAFQSVTGETFKRYLNKQRVHFAARLIKEGESITAAARLAGYAEFSTFYRNFKKILGISPHAYKYTPTQL